MEKRLKIKKYIKHAVILTIFAIILVFIIFSKRYLQVSLNGLKMYAGIVLPALLPFFILTTILTKIIDFSTINKLNGISKKIFNLPAVSLYAFFISISSGYPVGTNITKELYNGGYLTKDQAVSTSILSSTSGPIFIIGSVGSIMYGNVVYGFIIYISHILAVLTSAIILRPKDRVFTKNIVFLNKNGNIIYDSVYSSVLSVAVTGGFIVLFYIICNMLYDFKLLDTVVYVLNLIINDKNVAKGFTFGLVESTFGLKTLSLSHSALSVAFSCSLISLGGVSILTQCYVILKSAKLKPTKFFVGKILQSVFAFVYSLLLFTVFC